jgi:hypothetical protein
MIPYLRDWRFWLSLVIFAAAVYVIQYWVWPAER